MVCFPRTRAGATCCDASYVALFAMLGWFACRARGWTLSAGLIVASYVVALVGQMVFSAQTADLTYTYGGITDGLRRSRVP